MPWWLSLVLVPLAQLVLALFVSSLVVMLVGEDPIKALKFLITGAVGSNVGLSYTLYYTTNLIFTGLAVAVAFQIREQPYAQQKQQAKAQAINIAPGLMGGPLKLTDSLQVFINGLGFEKRLRGAVFIEFVHAPVCSL